MRIGIIVAALIITGCAAKPPLTREQQLEMQTRAYAEHKPSEVIRAAETVLTLADASDTKFGHHQTGFRAERDWFAFMLITAAAGTWYWQFDTEPLESGGVRAQVAISQAGMAITGTSTGVPGGVQTTTMAMPGRMETHPAPYELFWARMDYLLGKRPTWPYCETWREKIDRDETYYHVEVLCGPGAERSAPEGVPNPRPPKPEVGGRS